MASPIDLCTVSDVRAYLSIVSGLPNNSSETSEVSTVSNAGISAGTNVVVTPLTMANIATGSVLGVDTGANLELVSVTATSGSSFTATFAKNHATTPVPITDMTNYVIGRLITSAGAYWMWATGQGDWDGSGTQSPFVQPLAYSEAYDGNGNLRLFLRHRPVQSVALLQVNGVTIPQSTAWNIPGYVIEDGGKSLAIRSMNGYGGAFGARGFGGFGYTGYSRLNAGYAFAPGVQNVIVQYTAGYSSVPPDIIDACTEMVATKFQRRRYLDQMQNISPPVGTVTFAKWELSPAIVSVMDNYSRNAFV